MAAAMKTPQDNRAIKRQRVMRYFVDAAREIANTDGLEAINIRSVANRAGYNSASLYNYFENLDELIALTCVDMMSDWLRSLARISDEDGDELDQYLLGWQSFGLHAFAEPTGYAYVYSSRSAGMVARYFDTYMEAFPDVFEDIPDLLLEMFQAKTVDEQEEIMIRPCIEAGFFDHETAKQIYQLAHILFSGMLDPASDPENRKTPGEYTQIFMMYFVDFIQSRLKIEKDLSRYTQY